MFISIEGIDGAGKTSVAKKLVETLGYCYSSQKELSKYMEIDNALYLKYCHNYRKNVKSNRESIFLLYSLSCYLSSTNDNVVCDRHLPTVYFWYGNDNSFLISELIYSICKKPDITFILDVDIETAINNINKKRIKNEITEKEFLRDIEKAKNAATFVPFVKTFLAHFKLNYFVIDAKNKTIGQIHDEIISIINCKHCVT